MTRDGELKKRKEQAQTEHGIMLLEEEAVNKLLREGGYLVDWKPSADGETVSRDQYLKLLVGGKYGDERLVLYRNFCLQGRDCITPHRVYYGQRFEIRRVLLGEPEESDRVADKLGRMKSEGVTEDLFNLEARPFALWLMSNDLEKRFKKMKR